jgi:C_GCAxxG_C_C family probable redox protein
MVTLQQRLERARQLRREGYNCAQCVAMVFNPELGNVTAGLGGGVGGTGHICGAASAMAVIASDKCFKTPADKGAVYDQVQRLLKDFALRNQGQTNCCDLRRPGRKSCLALIEDAVEILHNEYADTE